MAAYFDDNDWKDIEEEKLRFFYEEFSASVRKQLLNKNLLAPQNVYDVLYPRTRESLLNRNIVKITDLEESSKTIRDALVAKLVADNINLDRISEETRKSLLARNKIIQDANKLLNDANNFRKEILSKNKPDEGDLLTDSQVTRENNISKNTVDLSAQARIDATANEFRTNNISKNKPDTGDLLNDSTITRKDNLSANVSDTGDLLRDSASARDNNLSNNKADTGDLLNDSETTRKDNLSNNKADTGDLLNDSVTVRKDNLSANVPDTGDLLNDSAVTRKGNLSNNQSDTGDLLSDSATALKNNLAPNKPDTGDLLSDSATTLKNNLAPNKPDTGDLLSDSATTLKNNLSANKPDTGDLLNDSAITRKDNLSNNKQDTGDLLNDSASTRKDNLSNNKADTGDLLADSAITLKNNLSNNKPDTGDLLSDSATTLKNNLSANKPDTGDLLSDSAITRKDNLSNNKADTGDLLSDSATTLKNNLSNNKPDTGDLLTDSATTLKHNLAPNKPDTGDLLTDSATTLKNNLLANVPDTGDLLTDSATTLKHNLAPNKPDTGDLLTDSATTLKNNLAPNKPDTGDLLTDSATTLKNNLSANVPDTGDLLNDSAATLKNNLSANVPDTGDLLNDSAATRKNNLANNIPDNGDLLNDSVATRKNNVSVNVPDTGDLLNDSSSARNTVLSNNVTTTTFSLDTFSKQFRDDNLSNNAPIDPLGVVIEGLGTSAFLGVSTVLIQGVLLRQILLSKNKASRYTIDTTAGDAKTNLISKNDFQISKNEYTTSSANLTTLSYNGFHSKPVRQEVESQLSNIEFYNRNVAQDLQIKYGTNVGSSFIPASVGGGFYSINTTSKKGGFFDQQNAVKQITFNVPVAQGSITDAIRNYNLARNLYNLYNTAPGDLSSLTALQNNNDEGFQDLINKTIGHFKGNDSVGSQTKGNANTSNANGTYIQGGSPETLYRPQDGVIGSPESMMAKTSLGNPLSDTEFQSGAKGVMHIIRTIRNSDASKFSINYDVQNARKFVIGVDEQNHNAPKFARQKFSIANPYKPANAKKIQFYIQNYSSGQAFYFPPYIQDFSDSYRANWNSVNFLGRPEPVFTYNNSTREGTITFFVLTDYAQNVVLGTDFTKDFSGVVGDTNENAVFANTAINKIHFTEQDASQNDFRALQIQQSEANQKLTNKQAAVYTSAQKDVNANSPNKDVLNQAINQLQKDSNSLQQNQNDLLAQGNHGNLYSESNRVLGNVYKTTSIPQRTAGDIDSKAQDSKARIDQMVAGLAFQPAFFSGDKVDFLTKMDFLAKLTRPSTADEGSGFSFTRPPVCHIHLGDWWNSDIVVDNVSFSYADAPWTLDDGRTQPMWATVTISFNFIGTYRGQQGGPVLSDDINGFYALRGTPSKSIK